MNDQEERHESFGQIAFSRTQGNKALFGSHLPTHQSIITLRVARTTKLVDDAGVERFHSDRCSLIEVDLSPAQFAELLTTMNVGGGVPCTLVKVGGEQMAGVPDDIDVSHENVRKAFVSRIKSTVRLLNGAVEEGRTLSQSKSFTKTKAKEFLSVLEKASREVTTNAPYFLELFQEAAEKVVTAAKAEVDAFTTHAVMSAGLNSLRLGSPVTASEALRESAQAKLTLAECAELGLGSGSLRTCQVAGNGAVSLWDGIDCVASCKADMDQLPMKAMDAWEERGEVLSPFCVKETVPGTFTSEEIL